jgi:hypothetical protein
MRDEVGHRGGYVRRHDASVPGEVVQEQAEPTRPCVFEGRDLSDVCDDSLEGLNPGAHGEDIFQVMNRDPPGLGRSKSGRNRGRRTQVLS